VRHQHYALIPLASHHDMRMTWPWVDCYGLCRSRRCSLSTFFCESRDIKPENIFLTSSLRFKLGDFGLAIKADEELPFTRSGTLDYMAPEVRLMQSTSDINVRGLTSGGMIPQHC
jgi:serine/threonine protein kinase